MPGGGLTLTFLLTDVVDSTARWEQRGDAMRDDLSRHDEVLRRCVAEHGGDVFKHTGDGVAAVFPSAVAAARAALAAQAQLALPVRMGLDSGEAQHRDGDWFGPTLNRAARVADAGHGGQVVCGSRCAALLQGAVALTPLGDYRLKGIDRAEPIFQVGPGRFPPLRAQPVADPLPELRNRLVGRDDLIADVVELLTVQRLVTLIGPGGVGKTSVAVAAARAAAASVERAVFVDLSVVDQPDSLAVALAHALGLSSPSTEALELALSSATTLLVLDNCEHLVDAAADVADRLLARCPTVRILATSREALEVDGERVVVVAPLTEDDELVALFVERAMAAGGQETPPEERALVVELCRRLDGLPLAIELAAARLDVLSLPQLLARLDDRLRLLGSGRRRGRDRHRTLRDTIEWSYELLSGDERALYADLAVFSDWFDLEAAATTTARDEFDALDGLEALNAKSLLVVGEGPSGRRRYRFLESIRDHAWEQLGATGRRDEVFVRMVDHLGDRIEALVHDMVWSTEPGASEELLALLPLQRRAIEWCAAAGDLDRGIRLVRTFTTLGSWDPRFVANVPLLLQVPGALEHEDAVVLVALETLDRMYRQEFRAYRPARERLRTLAGSDDALTDKIGSLVGFLSMIAGDVETTIAINERLAARPGPLGASADVLVRAERLLVDGRPNPTEIDELVRISEALPSPALRSGSYVVTARAALVADPSRVGELCDRASALIEPGSSAWNGAQHIRLGWHLWRGDLDAAVRDSLAVVDNARRLGEHSALVPPMAIHALVLQRLGDAEGAALVRSRVPKRWSVFFVREREALDAWLSAELGEERLADLARRAALLPLDDVLDLAPAALSRHAAAGRPAGDPAVPS